ncbi:helix-turn-helix domain-containing protein [Amycolatopsis sp. EV170708-02-1]|uniref:winged helix-turn-helix transcriptional regulator n=1 Tax=Amycolatopsis sp. EV170708-02-1 TaxID=2919322 RepID=UPI001F0BE78E|nr:winged helix-turn-helix transcriptional regulator [Amycolatopsis sp. EV170708-02-1]UMP07227.1 winged helix-turn-helix transcriptional regulator [Amycolatopsis sp. EV170708-02-1]
MRGFDDPCGIARALGQIGERWALLVVRELLLGPKRFSDLRRGLPGISENVLSQRLRELEHANLVRRRRFAPSSTSAYELTGRGRELEPVLMELRRWGEYVPLGDAVSPALGIDALVLALTGRFTAGDATPRDAVVQLRFDDDHFLLVIKNGRLLAKRAEVDDADSTITTTAATLQSLVFDERTIADAERSGDLTITGDRDTVEHLLRCSRHSGEARPVPTTEQKSDQARR